MTRELLSRSPAWNHGVLPLGAGVATQSYRVFLSSGDDAQDLRDRSEALFHVADTMLVQLGVQARVDVDRWEHTAAHRGTTGHINDEFVERAKLANLTVALLRTEIRPGTFEELTAVLEDSDRDIAVIWFHDDGDTIDPSLSAFLDKYRNQIKYSETGPPDDDSSWYELAKVLLFFLLRIIGAS